MGGNCMKGADLSQPFNFQMEPQKGGEIIPDKITSRLGQARAGSHGKPESEMSWGTFTGVPNIHVVEILISGLSLPSPTSMLADSCQDGDALG